MRQFLVKWKGQPDEQNTWINEQELITMHNLAVSGVLKDSVGDQRSSVSIQSPPVSDATQGFWVNAANTEPGSSKASRKSRPAGSVKKSCTFVSPKKHRSPLPRSASQETDAPRSPVGRGGRAKSVFASRSPEKPKTRQEGRAKSVFTSRSPEKPKKKRQANSPVRRARTAMSPKKKRNATFISPSPEISEKVSKKTTQDSQRIGATSTPKSGVDTSRDELGWYDEDGVRRSSRKKVDHNLPEAIDDPMENSLPDGGQSQDEGDEVDRQSQPRMLGINSAGFKLPSAISQSMTDSSHNDSTAASRRSMMDHSRSSSMNGTSQYRPQNRDQSIDSSFGSNEMLAPLVDPRQKQTARSSIPPVETSAEPAVMPLVRTNSPPRKRRYTKKTSVEKDVDAEMPSTSSGHKKQLQQYEVENILGAKFVGLITWYLVQWKGYSSPNDNTWEELSSLRGAMDRVKDFALNHGRASAKKPFIMSPEGETAEAARTEED